MRTTLCCVLTEEMHLRKGCMCVWKQHYSTQLHKKTEKKRAGCFLGGCIRPRIHMSKYGTQRDTNTNCHASCPPILQPIMISKGSVDTTGKLRQKNTSLIRTHIQDMTSTHKATRAFASLSQLHYYRNYLNQVTIECTEKASNSFFS